MSMVLSKPSPTANALTYAFWEKTAEHIFQLQRCDDCHQSIFYPRRHCPHCWSERLSTTRSAGRGTVVSIVEVHKAGHAAFQGDTPYYVALIDLDEGVRIVSNVVRAPAEVVNIGARVELLWREQNGFTLPLFSVSHSTQEEGTHEART